MAGKEIRMERVMDRNIKKAAMVPLIHRVGMSPAESSIFTRPTIW